MNKKVINKKASTREEKLYQRDKARIYEYYEQNFNKKGKSIDIKLNIFGYTNIKK